MCTPALIAPVAGLVAGAFAASGGSSKNAEAPKATKAPAAPAPVTSTVDTKITGQEGTPQTATDKAVIAARQDELKRAALQSGTAGTILTSPLGTTTQATTKKKSLLGG